MKVIVWGINYAPEVVGIGPFNKELCEYLARQGHEVDMVTTFPYYPAWKKSTADHFCWYRIDQAQSVKIHRCWHYVPTHVRSRWRIIHEASFVLISTLFILTLPAADGIVVVSPPLLLGLAAAFIQKVRGMPFVFHVQDLQPDAALGLGLLHPGWFARTLYWLESVAYRYARKVSGISQTMVEAFVSKGMSREKTLLFPNGVYLPAPETIPKTGGFRNRMAISEETFLAVYSGNLGKKQGLGQLLEAAALLESRNVMIVIAGQGTGREELEKMLANHPLRNVLLLPLQTEPHYVEMLVDADVCLITQDSGSGRFFLPSKLLKILAYGRPVYAVSDESSPLVQELKEGGFGVWSPSNQPELIAQGIVELMQRRAWLQEAGWAGRKFVEQFAFERVLPQYEKVLQGVFSKKH